MLSGDSAPDKAQRGILRQIEELSQVFQDADSRSILAEASTALIEGHYYRVLKSLRGLIPREERLMALRPI